MTNVTAFWLRINIKAMIGSRGGKTITGRNIMGLYVHEDNIIFLWDKPCLNYIINAPACLSRDSCYLETFKRSTYCAIRAKPMYLQHMQCMT